MIINGFGMVDLFEGKVRVKEGEEKPKYCSNIVQCNREGFYDKEIIH